MNGTNIGPADDYPGQARVIESFGKGSCAFYDSGGSVQNGINQDAAGDGRIPRHDAIVFAAIAVTAYCPKYKPEFDTLMRTNNIVLKQTSWTPADNTYGGPTSTSS
ncbi:DUF732 domain-containing protein [Arthrobacter sp. NPDC056691]|uniref:DUF732 domain-containing protein n=1 Tax=Arthrobacter sp. NPDC056691 TaxID=3345913 RepID=UPI00366C92E2